MPIRQPIVSVLGHVDHGKTTFLDRIRGTTVADREAGKITQHIGATEVPVEALKSACQELGCKVTFSLPGLLFIDTPGHHSFMTLRSRGGALSDLAVLVVDIKDGLMPQTKESIEILKRNQTPFIIAANKIDKIAGWNSQNKPFIKSFTEQTKSAQDRMTEALYEIIGELYDMGFSSDRYDSINDFSKNIAIVPMSAETGEGVEDTLMTLIGLAQRFLKDELEVEEGPGQGTILEVKEEVGLGTTLDTIIYQGTLRKGDEVFIGTRNKPIKTRIKSLLKPKPMDEIRDPKERFDEVKEVTAAAGIKVITPECKGVVAGAPVKAIWDRDPDEVMKSVRKESEANIELHEEGLVIKADAIGSLEGLAFELKDEEIPIGMASVGDVSQKDIVNAETMKDPLHKIILAFNVSILPDAKEELKQSDVKIIENDVVYRLVDDYKEWRENEKRKIEEEKRRKIVFPCKLRILEGHTFRVSKPAIVGVRILGGQLQPGRRLLKNDGRVVGNIKSIRDGDQSLDMAEQGDEVAIAISGVTVGRQIDEEEDLYIDMPQGDAKKLNKLELTYDEQRILDEIKEIKQKEETFWGM